jgi:hydrogenase maturation protein HypF
MLAQMMKRGINSPPTSSLGRLFDAVAALLGLRNEVLYEGQAAIELEIQADGMEEDGGDRIHRVRLRDELTLGGRCSADAMNTVPTIRKEAEQIIYPFTIQNQVVAKLDVAPMIRAIVDDIQQGVPMPRIAGGFHRSIAELLAMACVRVREQTRLNVVALSGGVFQNRLLLERLVTRLEEMNFQVYTNRRVPPNDGGLSLGQAAVAAARIHKDGAFM